jgi:dTDP-4-amino-4,6-dideoxygalactose transaminase
MISVFRAKLPDSSKLQPYLDIIDKNRIYSNFGPLNTLFRERMAEYLSLPVENIATCSNATLALEGAISTLDLQYSDLKVRLPSWTFAATAHAVQNSNRVAKFGEINSEGFLKLDSAAPVIQIPVLPFGAQPNFNLLRNTHGPLVVDAAASFYALKFCGDELNSIKSDIIFVISLHATKSLGAGEGAVVFSNSCDWIERFRRWTNFSFDDSRVSQVSGTNAKLSEFNSAVALASLDVTEINRSNWHDLNQIAVEISDKFSITVDPTLRSNTPTTYWNIYLNDINQRKELEKHLASHEIQTKRWWSKPCHLMPAFSTLGRESMVTTEQRSAVYTALPMHLFLEDKDFVEIKERLYSFFD